jgi:hypothetical protein
MRREYFQGKKETFLGTTIIPKTRVKIIKIILHLPIFRDFICLPIFGESNEKFQLHRF